MNRRQLQLNKKGGYKLNETFKAERTFQSHAATRVSRKPKHNLACQTHLGKNFCEK